MSARVAVLVPVFDQAPFLARSLESLRAQRLQDWEAAVVDDGSRDHPERVVVETLGRDPRVTLLRHDRNRGLGAALNTATAATAAEVIAYLPADDVWDDDHLDRLVPLVEGGAALAWSGVRWTGGSTDHAPPGFPLQLVQVAHRRDDRRWPERAELESDDLELLRWRQLREGATASTGSVTCTWVEHPGQRHKVMRESCDGGINVFRSTYRVAEPLRFHSSDSGFFDEVAVYARFRERPPTPPAPDRLRILLVGELSYNPERVLALEERGHELFGLWTDEPLGPQAVGPLPCGHVTDVPHDSWRDAVEALAPDVVYALQGWRAVPFAAQVRRAFPHIPLVWQFKEAPQACLRNGTWPDLVDLTTSADEVVLATDEERAWFLLALAGRLDPDRVHVVDGDLPKVDWFDTARSPRLSERDGDVHTVVLGRPLGIDADLLVALGRAGVHTHLHGAVVDRGPTAGWWNEVARAAREVPGFVHVEPKIDPPDWVSVLSRYDAGWLHRVPSDNRGDLRRATWDDLNAPARLAVYFAAGLPVLQRSSPASVVAVERIAGPAAVLYENDDDLVERLHDSRQLAAARTNAWGRRHEFAYDTYADRVVDILLSAVRRHERRTLTRAPAHR